MSALGLRPINESDPHGTGKIYKRIKRTPLIVILDIGAVAELVPVGFPGLN